MKTVLFCPGFFESMDDNYKKSLALFKSTNYRFVFVPIKWRYATIDDWLKELSAVYNKYNPKDVILAGFSFGAMIALRIASARSPSELWLFSLSPYFPDDELVIHPVKFDLKVVGKKRFEAFRAQPSFLNIAEKINCKVQIFCGANEIMEVKARAQTARELIRDSQLTIIKNGKHCVNESYIKTVIDTVE
jgi:pimeloyl-ACP methyl ester carboxylesterase